MLVCAQALTIKENEQANRIKHAANAVLRFMSRSLCGQKGRFTYLSNSVSNCTNVN